MRAQVTMNEKIIVELKNAHACTCLVAGREEFNLCTCIIVS